MPARMAVKERDIRPADLFERYLELSRQDAKALFFDVSAFENAPCVGCGGAESSPAFVKAGFCYIECPKCRSLFVSPRPSRSALDRFYADSPSATYWAETFFPAVAEARREKIFKPRVEQIAEIFTQRRFQPKTVIEVGAGYGIFLEEFKKRFPSSIVGAVEPGEKLAEICRAKGIETLRAAVEGAGVWRRKADLVVCFEVIEHVYAPLDFVNSTVRLVKPGGWLLMTGLGVEGFDIQTLWDKSKSVSPPHHLNFMSVQGFELDLLMTRRDAHVHEQFQKFLAESFLSSHVWILAQKPVPCGAAN
ncbi:MAG: class I SAM-dependent methyltransferase [Elusimicrobia bacterium]|nr:class I SAM-dependent methyltransferase [Elusimicrobiota bacterium]